MSDNLKEQNGDPEFLRKVASEMRSRHDLRTAMELERIADELSEALKLKPIQTMKTRG